MTKRKAAASAVEDEEDPSVWGLDLADAHEFESLRRSSRARKPVIEEPPESPPSPIVSKKSSSSSKAKKKDVGNFEHYEEVAIPPSSTVEPTKKKRGRPPKNRGVDQSAQHQTLSQHVDSVGDDEELEDEHVEEDVKNVTKTFSSNRSVSHVDLEKKDLNSVPPKGSGIAKRVLENIEVPIEVPSSSSKNLSVLVTPAQNITDKYVERGGGVTNGGSNVSQPPQMSHRPEALPHPPKVQAPPHPRITVKPQLTQQQIEQQRLAEKRALNQYISNDLEERVKECGLLASSRNYATWQLDEDILQIYPNLEGFVRDYHARQSGQRPVLSEFGRAGSSSNLSGMTGSFGSTYVMLPTANSNTGGVLKTGTYLKPYHEAVRQILKDFLAENPMYASSVANHCQLSPTSSPSVTSTRSTISVYDVADEEVEENREAHQQNIEKIFVNNGLFDAWRTSAILEEKYPRENDKIQGYITHLQEQEKSEKEIGLRNGQSKSNFVREPSLLESLHWWGMKSSEILIDEISRRKEEREQKQRERQLAEERLKKVLPPTPVLTLLPSFSQQQSQQPTATIEVTPVVPPPQPPPRRDQQPSKPQNLATHPNPSNKMVPRQVKQVAPNRPIQPESKPDPSSGGYSHPPHPFPQASHFPHHQQSHFPHHLGHHATYPHHQHPAPSIYGHHFPPPPHQLNDRGYMGYSQPLPPSHSYPPVDPSYYSISSHNPTLPPANSAIASTTAYSYGGATSSVERNAKNIVESTSREKEVDRERDVPRERDRDSRDHKDREKEKDREAGREYGKRANSRDRDRDRDKPKDREGRDKDRDWDRRDDRHGRHDSHHGSSYRRERSRSIEADDYSAGHRDRRDRDRDRDRDRNRDRERDAKDRDRDRSRDRSRDRDRERDRDRDRGKYGPGSDSGKDRERDRAKDRDREKDRDKDRDRDRSRDRNKHYRR